MHYGSNRQPSTYPLLENYPLGLRLLSSKHSLLQQFYHAYLESIGAGMSPDGDTLEIFMTLRPPYI